ncbi:MAG: DUF4369 domain-containing protein [Muribaculaceae bacterium]|nr:DUF4369 domain-containing protein [Muribaculaceae bacterium]
MINSSKYQKLGLASLIAVCVLGMGGCKKNEFKVNGTVEGGSDKSIVLEKADFHGRWIPVDSARVGGTGSFSITSARPSSPEIYRLSLGDRYIYLPVDSTETLTVSSTASKFGHEFTVTGSPQAEKMAAFEKELLALDFNDKAKRDEFKKNVYSKYLKDAQGGIMSYYVLTKTVGNTPLYDVTDNTDAKYYAAVATAFEQFRPNDPHVGMLRQASIDAMKRKNSAAGRKRVVEAEEIKLIDITLPDETGTDRRLSDVVGHGKKGVMIVSMMNEKESPAINKALADLYNSRGGAVTFYMVSLDSGLYEWREAAKNLPWVTVSDSEGRNSGILTKYNVTEMPAFFIFDTEGQLIDRAVSIDELKTKI